MKEEKSSNNLVPSALEIKASSTIVETCKLETVLTSQRVILELQSKSIEAPMLGFPVNVPPHVIEE